ncbi:hypothetical protein NDU88_001876 [Pleurodeles waltl]|uniref:Uncharacterized protein n=1 Tax=Pleurodeles waltl TaxID=8319 RepID=A0AAV7UVZ3_PLEWA|nr:hypothetical protein NDU88_001876 [Pleurodeles waltl]
MEAVTIGDRKATGGENHDCGRCHKTQRGKSSRAERISIRDEGRVEKTHPACQKAAKRGKLDPRDWGAFPPYTLPAPGGGEGDSRGPGEMAETGAPQWGRQGESNDPRPCGINRAIGART